MWSIFKNSASLHQGIAPDCWKKAHVVPIHKKDKNLLKNYRPIILWPIVRKAFERVIFKEVFNYLHQNEGFTKLQSSNSCVLQLLSVIDEYNSPFDYDPTIDTGGVFLDISKASTCKTVIKNST